MQNIYKLRRRKKPGLFETTLASSESVDEVIARAKAYLAAGADGIFLPGVQDIDTIRGLAAQIPAPLNVMIGAGSPSVRALMEAGARRVSAGMSLAQAAYALVEQQAHALLRTGGGIGEGVAYDRLNALLAAVHSR